MNEKIGDIAQGRISKTGKTYQGPLPFEPNEDVVIMRAEDLEMIVRTELGTLMRDPITMADSFYGVREDRDHPIFVDGITFIFSDGVARRYNLDRKLYSPDLKNQIWIRYCTTDQAIAEGEFSMESVSRDDPNAPVCDYSFLDDDMEGVA